jgi:hypothetical protein
MSGAGQGDDGTAASAVADGLNDAIYDSLGDRRRRYAVHYLKQCGGSVPVRELAEQVAAWENDTTVEGLVDYDDEDGTVELADALASADIYLEVVPEADIPWNLYYVGLSAANALLLALAWFGVDPFAQLPDLGWAVVVLVTFAASAFVQTYTSSRSRFGDDGPPPGVSGQK